MFFLVYLTYFNYSYFYDKTSLPYFYHKKGYYCHVATNETCVSRRSIIMSGKHAKSVFYQGMYTINVFHVILYIKIYFAQTTLCIVIVVNRRCDVSNAISSEISMD